MEMERECFIGIDQGSSSTKVVVVARDGSALFSAKHDLPPPFREGQRVEQDPEAVLGSVRDALYEAVRWARDNIFTVQAAGLSCQRSSCLVWDEASGEPLSPVLSWRDTRASSLVESLAPQRENIFTITGLPLTPYYSASKVNWLFENVSLQRAQSPVFGTLSSYLCRRLTGTPGSSIDHSNAARTQLMDIRTLSWDHGMLALFGIEKITLPRIVPTATDYGVIDLPDGRIPLLASIGDQQAALLGLGIKSTGEMAINYGTGGFLMMSTGSDLRSVPGLLSSIHYSTAQERHYLLEGTVNAAGDALEWLRTRFGIFESYDEVDDLCWQASTDVIAFLGLNGTGSPHWERHISSAFHGLTAGSERADLVRAVVEGIVFFLQDIVDIAATAGVRPSVAIASGGLSSLSYLVQAQADLLGENIVVSPSPEASARGAAFLAGIQRGTWNVQDIDRMGRSGETVSPRSNPGLERRRLRWMELHRAVRLIDSM
jgi:glycerol kinase